MVSFYQPQNTQGFSKLIILAGLNFYLFISIEIGTMQSLNQFDS